MGVPETQMGGSREAFPDTAWSSILSCPDPNSEERRERLNRLCAQYWKPVYRFIRAAWRRSIEDAKDLAQAFFCRVIESDLVSKYQAHRGRFRHFLKASLQSFLAEAYRESHRQKRGGGRVIVSLDVEEMEAGDVLPDGGQASPEEQFDRQWASDVMAESLRELRRRLQEEGKEALFRVFEAHDLTSRDGLPASYESVARDLGMSVSDVRNHLHIVRSRLKEVVAERISDYVASREEMMEEMRELFGR